jgi:hypothetical protein
MEANLEMELAKREHAASMRLETARKYELAKATAERLRSEATLIVERLGTAEEQARLAALLGGQPKLTRCHVAGARS